ncbi:arabinosyltransferase C [Geodermatophilus tzadiensis]|uniref:Arabinosyltransferase C n=1 Tax=Geodermatophilus tzadiensis TaxID=1137988 RepID=A0A2T0U1T0_9ACTN|nr:arabinosyltransferase domain-containing protein [Geodermatophilus tzadiensis]PRY51882.1 arabinosyltransferase C [Geodermatophilus tzadiensis]
MTRSGIAPRPVVTPPPPVEDRRRRPRWTRFAQVAALVAVLAVVLLPVAPVEMERPVVSWPQDPSAPVSSMLELTAQTPLELDARFTCAAARVADGTDGGVVLATVVPGQPSAGGEGLLAATTDGTLDVYANGRQLVTDAPLDGDCVYTVTGDAGGLTVARDGETVAQGEPGRLPAVDVLATSVTALDTSAGEDLSVELVVDDQFATSPSPLKWVLVALVVIGAALALAFLVAEDRAAGRHRERTRRVGGRFSVVDLVVPAVMVAWVFLAPMSDDDGYYAAMARSAADEGMVGNYYQLLNQNFTPFTWFYRVLGEWQVFGDSSTVQRIPALVTGLLTWWALRRFTTQPGALPAVLERSRRGRAGLQVVLALTLLAWWLPYGMGVRPEAAVGFLAVATLLAVSVGVRQRRLALLGVAAVTGALGMVAHPTGFVALAPLLVGLPAIVGVVREGVPAGAAWLRGLTVLAPGAVAGVAAFGDGSLNDFLRGQQIFLSIQAQNDWFDEYQRWNFLFSEIAMGSFAKRTAVLLGVASLLWFAVLAAASRRRGTLSPQLVLAAQSLAAAFLLLWITPSKWTHHFGALSGLGPAFLALFLTSLPVLVRTLPGRRPGWPAAVPALGTLVLLSALVMHGPNSWAYSWLQGVPHAFEAPFVGPVSFDSPVLWLAAAVAVVLLVRVAGRRLGLPRRRPWLTAVPVLASVLLATSVLYLVGGFAYGALRTLDGYSPWSDAITDPLARDCGAAQGIDLLDVEAARPLAATGEATGGDGVFTEGGGWYPPSPPPTPAGEGPATYVWGSLDGETDGEAIGALTSPWFELPADLAADERVTVLVSGKLDGEGNRLTVEYGRSSDDGEPAVVSSAEIQDGTQAAIWRTVALDVGPELAAGADAVRLVAEDGTTTSPGWLAVTGPSVVPVVALSDYTPADAPVGVAWQFSWLFPCERQLDITSGITEPMQYAVMWGDRGVQGVADATWQFNRGGLFAPTLRTSSVTLVGGAFRDWPGIRDVQVYRVVAPYAADAYDLDVTTDTRWGWQGPEEARWPYPQG